MTTQAIARDQLNNQAPAAANAAQAQQQLPAPQPLPLAGDPMDPARVAARNRSAGSGLKTIVFFGAAAIALVLCCLNPFSLSTLAAVGATLVIAFMLHRLIHWALCS